MKLVEFKTDSTSGHPVYINPEHVTEVEAYVEDRKPSIKTTRIWCGDRVSYVFCPVAKVVAKLRAA